MALYGVINTKAEPGATESALIVTSGARKARLAFIDRFGGKLEDIMSEPVDVNSRDGERVLGSWLNEMEPTADEIAKASVLADDVF